VILETENRECDLLAIEGLAGELCRLLQVYLQEYDGEYTDELLGISTLHGPWFLAETDIVSENKYCSCAIPLNPLFE
jgi:hypothetical protein